MTFQLFAAVAIKATVILAIAWGVASLMRNRSAASRHLVWIAAAMALAALPTLSVYLPDMKMPGSQFISSATAIFESNSPAGTAQAPTTSEGQAAADTAKTSAERIDWRRVVI